MSSKKENEMENEMEYLRKIAKKKVIRRTALQIHITTYVFINTIIFIINFLTTDYLWFLWVISGWGILLGYHIFAFFHPRGPGIDWHAFSYLIINLMILFVFFFTKATSYPYYLWPITIWGVGLLTHYLVYRIRKPKKGEDKSKKWIERKIDSEIIKMYSKNQDTVNSCPKCGLEIVEKAEFCPSCGERL